MVASMLQIFSYNPTKTNLTYIGMSKYAKYGEQYGTRYQIAYTRETTIGSINSLSNLIHMIDFETWGICATTGNINTAFNNMNKLYVINCLSYHYNPNNSNGDGFVMDNTTSGNINVLSNKYNLEYLGFERYPNVTGEIKSLKNLKKFSRCYLGGCSCTGAKTDLYNNGANITGFEL